METEDMETEDIEKEDHGEEDSWRRRFMKIRRPTYTIIKSTTKKGI